MTPALPGLLLSAVVTAADVIVIRADLSATEAARQVARDGGPPAATLDPVTLTGLAGGRPPFIVGDGHVIPCGRAPTTAQAVADQADKALRLLVRLEPQAARDALDSALQELGCQKDRASPDTSARLYYLSGLVRIDQQWPEKARADFVQALVYDPSLQWDARFDPEEGKGASLLEQARTELRTQAPAELELVPSTRALTVEVDGIAVEHWPLQLPPGEHVVQLHGGTTTTVRAWLDPGGHATLAVPGLLEEHHAYALPGPDSHQPIITTLAPALPEHTDLWLATPAGTWRQTTDGSFGQVAAHKPRTRKYVPANAWLGSAGGLVLVGAGTWSAIQLWQANRASTAADRAQAHPTYVDHSNTYAQHASRYRIGLSVAGGGAALALVGATFPLGRIQYGEETP